jgi:xylulokinase
MTGAFVGVDIGTRSTKAVAIDHNGALLGSVAVDHQVDCPEPGRFEHDATQVWWLGVVAALRSLLSTLPSGLALEGVGLTACGPCLVPVDHGGEPLRPGILYGVDTRAAEQVRRLERDIGPEQILADYGMPLTSQSAGPKIDWLAEIEPAVYARTAHLLTANGFAAWRLTGEVRCDHHQAAYFAPYYRAGQWDRTHDRWGVVDRLPPLAWSDEVIGEVTAAAAEATGLPVGLPVVLGSSDGLTAAYGAGTLSDATAVLNYGNTLGLTVMTTASVGTGGVWRTPGARPGELCLVAGLATAGALTSWFVEQFARELAADPDAAYEMLAAEAGASPPGAAGLLLLPYFAGERTPFYDPGAAGVLLGLRLQHTRGDHYRAILEGTGFGVRHLLDELAGMGVMVERIRAVGGGTRTALWPQVVSDITGVPQQVVGPRGGAAVGAALLTALGSGAELTGLWVDSDSVHPTLHPTLQPTSSLKPLYDERFRVFRAAYERTRPLISALAGATGQGADLAR